MKQISIERETCRETQRKETGPRLLGGPADEAKACGPGRLETQQEGMLLPIRKTFQTAKDTGLFKLADSSAGNEVLSGEAEVLRPCPDFFLYWV